jgi:hypothetical protein
MQQPGTVSIVGIAVLSGTVGKPHSKPPQRPAVTRPIHTVELSKFKALLAIPRLGASKRGRTLCANAIMSITRPVRGQSVPSETCELPIQRAGGGRWHGGLVQQHVQQPEHLSPSERDDLRPPTSGNDHYRP